MAPTPTNHCQSLPCLHKKKQFGDGFGSGHGSFKPHRTDGFSHFPTDDLYAYGEVGLNGEISTPENINLLSGTVGSSDDRKNFREKLSGRGLYSSNPSGDSLGKESSCGRTGLEKPSLPSTRFSPSAALILKLCAAGEHHLLLCGEAGSGKTTLAEHIYHLLPPPEKRFWEEGRQMHLTHHLSWRPYINPHRFP